MSRRSRTAPRSPLLASVGEKVRALRHARALSLKALAEKSGVSARFLAQLEAGDGNISLVRFAEVARALASSPAALLDERGELSSPAEPGRARAVVVALIGLRGAGKSTIGKKLATRLGVGFVELDRAIEAAAGLSLSDLFQIHGEAYYRRLERETLMSLLREERSMVIATGGSIVNDKESYRLLRRRTVTVWLKARPEDHWNRVIQQGDARPMADHPHAMAELRALLAARERLYAEAEHVVDTSRIEIDSAVDKLARIVAE